MTRLQWLPEARDDLQRLHDFIAPHSEPAAGKAISALLASAKSLTEFPEKGRPWGHEPGFRELPVRFGAKGYVIRYRVKDETVFVIRVWHALEGRPDPIR
jgi:plasmid stabilization system protein ParE